MRSILFVCTANRFRSPIAEAAFAREVVNRGDESAVQVSSAGTWTVSGQPPTSDAIQQAKKYALNLTLHKSRLITENILSESDLILVMEANHKEALAHEFPTSADRIYLLAEAANRTPYDIPDPYGTDEPPEVVAHEIIEIIDEGYEQIIELAHKTMNQD